jgi:rhodanese-related sulfurtransferase
MIFFASWPDLMPWLYNVVLLIKKVRRNLCCLFKVPQAMQTGPRILNQSTTAALRERGALGHAVPLPSQTNSLPEPQQETLMPFQIALQPTDSIVTLGLRFRLLDVREDHECVRRPIVSDYRIPYSAFDPRDLDLPSDTKLLVICEKGTRSLATATRLRHEGGSNIYSLQGGLGALLGDEAEARQGDTRAA